MRKPLAKALDIDLRGGLTDKVTPHAGVALLIETGRRSGVIAAAERALPAKASPKGLRQGERVEALVLLRALGGDCLADLEQLRRDQGLASLTGYPLPAAATARQWLDRFHDPAALADRPLQGSFIPVETQGLAGLRTAVAHSVHASVTAVSPARTVTLDVDAHLVESSTREALPTYTGERGYQPRVVMWAETGLVLADEFRDGNVPASAHIQELVDTAAAALPARAEGWTIRVRSDSAAYAHATVDHCDGRGWTFAVSADMSPQLRAAVVALADDAWQPWAEERGGVVRSFSGGGLRAQPDGRAQGPAALSLRGDSGAAAAGPAVRGRHARQALRRGEQRLGDRGAGVAGVAAGQGGDGGARQPRVEG